MIFSPRERQFSSSSWSALITEEETSWAELAVTSLAVITT
jgi:hypothetical protein